MPEGPSGIGVFMKKSRRLLAVLLALAMILSASASVFAAAGTGSEGPNGTGGANVTEIDPSTLNVKMLGDRIDLNVSEPAEKESKYAPEDIVRVSIVLDKKSTIDSGYSVKNYTQNNSARAYRDSLRTQQAAVAREISSRIGEKLDVKWNLTLAVNIISANVQYKDIQLIKLVPGVRNVFIEKQFAVQEAAASPDTANTSEYMVGATEAWATGYTGAGQLVAIVDSGIDYTHQAFDEAAFLYSINQLDETVDLLEESEIPADDLNVAGTYVSAKIPFAYNYVDETAELEMLGHMNDDGSNHGSHVAGIAAANRFIPGETEGTFVDAAENTYAVGMAPDAQLVVMKVFGQNGGAYESDYMVAIEDALVLGCASINLSLGSDSEGWTFSTAYQDTLNFLSSGSIETVLSISAGNNGSFVSNHRFPYLYADDVRTNTVGSPGSYINSLTVASADNTGRTGEYVVFDEGIKQFYYDTGSDKTKYPALKTIAGTYDYVYIDALGTEEDYAAVNAVESLAGKVVLINRGEISFFVKGNNVVPYNPKALIVCNYESDLMGMALDDYTGTFPMVLVSVETAEDIMESGTSHTVDGITYYTGSVAVSDEIYSDQLGVRPSMSSFSSWGGAGSLILKPDITAPGGFIYSVNGSSVYAQDYNTGPTSYVNYSGTSMAAPHITGLSAVLSQYLDKADLASRNTELTSNYSKRAIMQSLLMSTADPIFNERTLNCYPVMQQGSGLVNISNAINSKSVIMMGKKDLTLTAVTGAAADGKVKAELGDDLFVVDEKGSREFSFTIYNIDDRERTYSFGYDLFTQDWLGYDDYGNMIMSEDTTALNCDVDINFDRDSAGEYDVNKDGKTDKKDAQAVTDYITGEISEIGLDLTAADADSDGDITSYDAYLILNYTYENPDLLVIPAGGYADVAVTITPDAKALEMLDQVFENGSFLEGFFWVDSYMEEEDGAWSLDTHTIPVYGFLGNWTDPSMFDSNTLIDVIYGTQKRLDTEDGVLWNYTGNLSNYLRLTYSTGPSYFYGNPYVAEDQIPYEKFAINSRSVIKSIDTAILRSASSTGFAVMKQTDDGYEVIDAYVDEAFVDGPYYSSSSRSWEAVDTRSCPVNASPMDMGLKEGDRFRIGYYAIPEYYGIVLNMLMHMQSGDESPINGPYDGLVDTDEAFKVILENYFLGEGSYIGYDFTVDDTAPVIDKESIVFDPSAKTLSFSAEDNMNIAFAAVMDINGDYEYWYEVPSDPSFNGTIDISDAVDDVDGYIALFVADYAGNSTALSIQVNDDTTVDPNEVTSVTIDPKTIDVYKGTNAQLVVSVKPITADQTVIWTSEDTGIATVNEYGEVTGVSGGTTVVTACSAANEEILDTCTVHVLDPGLQLNALLMDEDSESFFVTFDSASLPNWERLHQDGLAYTLLNALNTSSGLIASTVSGSGSYLFNVDTETYQATAYAQNDVPAFDMAPFMYNGHDEWYFVYPYAYYLVLGDLETGEMAGAGLMADGINEDAWLTGVAAKSLGNGSAEYFIMDEFGSLYTVTFSTRTGFGSPVHVLDTGIKANYLYQNLYFDGTYLFWSYYKGNTAHMVVFDSTDDYKMYEAGSFGKSIWPATGFYVDGQIGAGVSAQKADDQLQPMTFEPSADVEAILGNEELKALVAARIAECERELAEPAAEPAPAVQEEPADQTDGGLNRVSGALSVNGKDIYAAGARTIEGGTGKMRIDIASMKETEPGSYIWPESYFDIWITEDEDVVTNGKYIVNYDPEKLTFNDYFSYVYATVGSIHDDGNGTVTVAFADGYGIEPQSTIAYLSFDTTEALGLELTVTTTERNEDLDLNEVHTVTSPEYPVTITKSRLELLSRIGIRLYFTAPENATKADIFFEDVNTNDYPDTPSVTMALTREGNKNYNPNTGEFLMIYPKITSRQMTMHVKLVVYDENGEPLNIYDQVSDRYWNEGFEFCAADWANRVLSKPDSSEEAVFFAMALLNYGGEAQKYLGNYNPDHPANPWGYLEEEMAAFEPDPQYDMKGKTEAEAIGLTQVKLDLAEETSIRMYFDRAVTVKVDGKDAKVYQNGNTYLVIINGIYSRFLNHMYEIEITSADGTQTLTYSALSWANDMIARNVENAIPTAKALYLYHYGAIAYLGQ